LRIIRVRKASILMLGLDRLEQAKAIAVAVDNLMPGFPLITLGGPESAKLLPELMHLGVRDHLIPPFHGPALAEALAGTRRRLETHPIPRLREADIYSFLPAKPGVGTSTIAVSASCAAAENLGLKTLLLDCDLAAGAIKFLLRLGNTASLIDAVSHAGNLDEDLWAQMIGKWDKLEVLHAGLLDPPPDPDVPGLERVLALARDQYEVVCADLASSIDPFSIAIMRESRRIFLVTTPEIVPLHLAAARLRRLSELGLDDRVVLLLNRKTKGGISDEAVADAVGIPVSHSFPNEYIVVGKAIMEAAPVERRSPLGLSILDLAQSFAPHVDRKPPAGGRKFLEFFHIAHVEEPEPVGRG
jgi:pilus assembly protein CpaE